MNDAAAIGAAIAASVAAAAAILLPAHRSRSIAMVAALLIAGGLLIGEAWDTQLRDLRDEPELAGGLILVAAWFLLGFAALFARYRWLLPIALLAALPFRVEIETGGDSFNLLVPLYVVIASGVVARFAPSSLRRTAGQGAPGREAEEAPPDAPRMPRFLAVALAAAVVLYAVQSAYSDDATQAVQNVGFFLVPFAVMLVLLFEVPWTTRLLKIALGVILVEAAVFAGVGVWQHETETVFWNSKVEESNEFHFYFRVNSLFWDPNIYGRYLALAVILGMACLLWERDRRRIAGLALLVALFFAGLIFSFSQTGFATVLAGLAVLAAFRWSLRGALIGAASLAVAGGIFLVAFGSAVEFDLSSALSLERSTSGRSDLVGGGIDLAVEEPVLGHGSGSFSEAFRERESELALEAGDPPVPEDFATVSHTEPVTVAAEQGALGLAVYVAVIAAGLAVLFSGIRALAPGLAHGAAPPSAITAQGLGRIAVAVMFIGLLIHTFGYAAYLTDPLSWALLAVGAALVVHPAAVPEPAERTARPAAAPPLGPTAPPSPLAPPRPGEL